MKTCTKCGETKSYSGFYGDKRAKDGLASSCKKCHNTRIRTRQKANPEKHAARVAAWQKANPDRVKSSVAAWQKANPDKVRGAMTRWRTTNPEKARAATAVWRKANPENGSNREAARRACKLQATPTWADDKAMALWYKGASIMTQLMGQPYHVDHVVPLKSKAVCGLHAHTNMQILPKTENCSKGNRYWPDMPQGRM